MTNNELVAVEESTAPTTIQPLQTVDVDAAKKFMNNYQELVEALLDKSDYQPIRTQEGIKNSKKKSAWRKLATAFNISDEVVEKEIIHDECHRIISARYEVRATLPNGRHGVGTGSASIYDKITKKDTVEPTPFELRQRFTNAEHDITSTAHTRAKSRAISDLIGAGEVSAEELSGAGIAKPSKPVKPVKPTSSKPKPSKPVTNNANLGNKPKAPSVPKPKRDILKEMPIEQIVAEAIEVEATEVKESNEEPKSFKEICDSNPALTQAVQELSATGITINTATVHDKLLDLLDMDKVTESEFKEAKKLLE